MTISPSTRDELEEIVDKILEPYFDQEELELPDWTPEFAAYGKAKNEAVNALGAYLATKVIEGKIEELGNLSSDEQIYWSRPGDSESVITVEEREFDLKSQLTSQDGK